MENKIVIVQNESLLSKSKEYFELFNTKFEYLKDIKLVFTPEYSYDKYEDDLTTIKMGWSTQAEIIDTRDIKDFENDPVRLILTDLFFECDDKQKDEIILHELGHYLTNPELIEIRNYLALKNPKLLAINSDELTQLVNAHNTGLNFVFQIPKLLQETRAELWLFENEPEFSKGRIEKYCSSISESINQFKEAKIDQGWFYQIPNINFLLLWRLSIISNLDFDYVKDCIEKTEEARILFFELASTVGWQNLEIFKLQDDVLNSLKYKEENIKNLILSFEQIFDDYISNSSLFFPEVLKDQIIQYYK